MTPVAIDSSHVLDRHLFSHVLKLYATNDITSFVEAALDLFGVDRLSDFSVAVLCRPDGGGTVARSSCDRDWGGELVQRQAALLLAIRSRLAPEQKMVVLPSSAEASDDEWMERFRHEMQEEIGSTHTVLFFLSKHSDSMSLLFSLHRRFGSQEFDQLELARLAVLRGYVENAWSLLNRRVISRVLIEGMSLALRNYNLGTVMLDCRLRVIWHNRAARLAVRAWKDDRLVQTKPPRYLGALPADIIAVCERLQGDWLGTTNINGSRKIHLIHHGTNPKRHATVRLCGVLHEGIAVPNLIVQFEQELAGVAFAEHSMVDSLTVIERQVADLVGQGKSNQEIADDLGKSVASVKFHLHRLFKKAEVSSRSRLMLVLANVG